MINHSSLAYVHYRGVLSFDIATVANTGSSSIPNPGNILPANAGEAIVVGALSTSLETAGSGCALRLPGNSGTAAWAIQDLINAPGGSHPASFGTSASTWSAIAITLIP